MKALDSTFIIDFLRNDAKAIKKATEIQQELIVTTAINHFEVLLGIHLSKENKERRLQSFEEFMENIAIYPLDTKASKKASEVAATLIKSGKTIEELDYLIAGILLNNSCTTIITRNTDHFKRIEGINVESY